jgi:hypothetical protein
MSKESPEWTTDMTFLVGNGFKISDVATYIKECFEESMDFAVIYEKLCSKFALAENDAELAIDRAVGGVVRALTTNIKNRPDENEDPVAYYLFNVVWQTLPSKGFFQQEKIANGPWLEWDNKRRSKCI